MQAAHCDLSFECIRDRYAEKAAVCEGGLNRGMRVLTKPFNLDALAMRIIDLLTTTHRSWPASAEEGLKTDGPEKFFS